MTTVQTPQTRSAPYHQVFSAAPVTTGNSDRAWAFTNATDARQSRGDPKAGRAIAAEILVIVRVLSRRQWIKERDAIELARARSRLRPDGGPSWAALKKAFGL